MKILLPVLIALTTAFGGAALAQQVGNVGAVNQSAEGNGQVLSVGSGIVERERVTTNAIGTAQIVFRDQSTMTIGRGSSITINKFVYNSTAGVGEQSAKLTKGALRFVGGGVSHTEGAKIETHQGTMSVRGGMAYVCLNCQPVIFAALTGEVSATNRRSTVVIPPGQMVTVLPDGSFSQPVPIPMDVLETLDSQFASGVGQDGGAVDPPTEFSANQRLGDSRMPDWAPWQGLAHLGAFWGGNAIVQGQAQSDNQSSANTVRVLTTPHGGPSSNPPPDGGGDLGCPAADVC